MNYIVVCGSNEDGATLDTMRFVGPFGTEEEAREYAEYRGCVIELEPPQIKENT